MRGKRLWHTLRLFSIPTGSGRANYLRKHNVYAHIGEHCNFQDRKLPLYPNLIWMGDHVRIATNVVFLTHDMVHVILNNWKGKKKLKETAGCIKIGNNVFIGANVTIHYNVEIGDNVVISSGSVVKEDIPSNSVVEGNPATIQCKLSTLYSIRSLYPPYPDNITLRDGELASKEAAEHLWAQFKRRRKQTEE